MHMSRWLSVGVVHWSEPTAQLHRCPEKFRTTFPEAEMGQNFSEELFLYSPWTDPKKSS